MSEIKIKLKVTNETAKIKVNSPDNLVNLTERAEDAAKRAEESASYVEEVLGNFEGKNLVYSVTEENGIVTVKKASGETNEFTVVKMVNGILQDDKGNVLLPAQFSVKVLGDSEI